MQSNSIEEFSLHPSTENMSCDEDEWEEYDYICKQEQ